MTSVPSHDAILVALDTRPVSEALADLHRIEVTGENRADVVDAIQFCLEQSNPRRQENMLATFRLLADDDPLSPLFFDFATTTVTMHVALLRCVLDAMRRLVLRKIWTNATAWEGFLTFCHHTLPNSMSVLLSLPDAQLREAGKEIPAFTALIMDLARRTPAAVSPQLIALLKD